MHPALKQIMVTSVQSAKQETLAFCVAVAALTTVLAAYDVRVSMTTIAKLTSRWEDLRSSALHGPAMVQGTSGSRPTFTDGPDRQKLVTFPGTTRGLATALSALFDLSAGITLVFIGQSNNSTGDYFASIVESSSVARGIALRVAANTYDMESFAVGTVLATSVPTGATRRVVMAGESTTAQSIEVPTSAAANGVLSGAPAAGSNALTLGGFWATGTQPFTVRAVYVLAGLFTAQLRDMFQRYGVLKHAVEPAR